MDACDPGAHPTLQKLGFFLYIEITNNVTTTAIICCNKSGVSVVSLSQNSFPYWAHPSGDDGRGQMPA